MKTYSEVSECRLDAKIKPDDRIVVGQLTGEPATLMHALSSLNLSKDNKVFIGIGLSKSVDMISSAVVESYGIMMMQGALAHREKRIRVYPISYSKLGDVLSTGYLPADVVLAQVARNKLTGRLHWSASNDYQESACRKARSVILECNHRAPAIPGAELASDLRIDGLIESNIDLYSPPTREVDEIDKKIAENVVSLIANESVVQCGLGGISTAVWDFLGNHSRLGVHSGIIGDAVMRLMESGVIDNSRKTVDVGKTVAGSLLGSQDLYRWADANPSLQLSPGKYTHSGLVISSLERFTAVNTALEVDLYGQVNSEIINGKYIGGLGGLSDYVRASQLAPHGQSIIAFRSCVLDRAGDESRMTSKIVGRLGGPAALTSADADIFVTEWGVAKVRNLSLRQRANALIEIAHPNLRERLLYEAKTMPL